MKILKFKNLIIINLILMVILTSCGEKNKKVDGETKPISSLDISNYPRVDGSTANLPLMASLYSKILDLPLEEAETKVHASTTSFAWMSILDKSADLLLVYEGPDQIKEEIDSSPVKLDIKPLGLDGLVFLVNKDNPIKSLTISQLQDIYSGKITDWKEVGGEPGPIAAFQRSEDSGSQTLFLKLLMNNIEPMKPPTELVPDTMAGLIEDLASFDGGGGSIGYSVFYYADLMYNNPNLKIIEVEGVPPSNNTIQDGTYPLTNPFFVVIREDEPKDSPSRLLRDWILTKDGSKLLEDTKYIPVTKSH